MGSWKILRYITLLTQVGALFAHEDVSRTIRDLEKWADRNSRPHYGGQKESIDVKFELERIFLNDTAGTMTIDLYIHETWKDRRIERLNITKTITLAKEFKIWTPDSRIVNGNILDQESKSRFGIQVFPDGKVIKRTRYLIKSQCKMNWKLYPMDQQICSLYIQGSITHPDKINYRSSQGRVKVRNVEPYEFYLLNASVHSQRNPFAFEDLTVEESQVLALKFKLNRDPRYYLLNYYLPSILAVSFSWLSFWSYSASNSLGCSLFSFFSMIYITYNFNWTPIETPVLRALDIFTLVSLGVIMSSLWDIISKRINRRKMDLWKKLDGDTLEETSIKSSPWLTPGTIIPNLYIGFIIVYWCVLYSIRLSM